MKNIITEAYANLYYVMCVLLLLSKSIKNKIYNIHTHIYISLVSNIDFFLFYQKHEKRKRKKKTLSEKICIW